MHTMVKKERMKEKTKLTNPYEKTTTTIAAAAAAATAPTNNHSNNKKNVGNERVLKERFEWVKKRRTVIWGSFCMQTDWNAACKLYEFEITVENEI